MTDATHRLSEITNVKNRNISYIRVLTGLCCKAQKQALLTAPCLTVTSRSHRWSGRTARAQAVPPRVTMPCTPRSTRLWHCPSAPATLAVSPPRSCTRSDRSSALRPTAQGWLRAWPPFPRTGALEPQEHLPCSPVPWVAPVQSWPEGPSRTRGTRHAAAASISAGLAWLADGPGPRLRSLTPTPHRPVPPTACPAHHSEPDAAGPRGAPAEAAAPGRAPRGAAGRV